MATLYVENVPEELYEALREHARADRTSISAKVIELLSENIPTAAELARRREFLKRVRRLRADSAGVSGSFSPTEELQRQDRRR